MVDFSTNKGFRLLSMYEALNKGEEISKFKLAQQYKVSEKSISRDIDDLRAYLAETHPYDGHAAIQYNKRSNTYSLLRVQREWLTNREVLAICKVILESRAFNKQELEGLLGKLLAQISPTSRDLAKNIILNEKENYCPVSHGKDLLDSIWSLSQFIQRQEQIKIQYRKEDGNRREHHVQPVAVMFSEYYFYLVAFPEEKQEDWPTIFRIDRMEEFHGTKESFYVPYVEKFNDGQFRNRVQFMFSGALRTVTFEFLGEYLEAVLDRLPTAELISGRDGVHTIKVEVYGNGIDIWLRSHGENVHILDG